MCYADEAETAVHGCQIPAGVIWLCACVGWWPHYGVDVTPCSIILFWYQICSLCGPIFVVDVLYFTEHHAAKKKAERKTATINRQIGIHNNNNNNKNNKDRYNPDYFQTEKDKIAPKMKAKLIQSPSAGQKEQWTHILERRECHIYVCSSSRI